MDGLLRSYSRGFVRGFLATGVVVFPLDCVGFGFVELDFGRGWERDGE